MARSLTVPWTAREPISPPRKKSGLTTKLSVVKARRSPPIWRTAWSSRRPRTGLRKTGRKTSRSRSALSLPPDPCPSRMRSLAGSGVGQVIIALGGRGLVGQALSPANLWVAKLGRSSYGSPEKVIRRAGAFARDHGRAQRRLRRASDSEGGAIDGFRQALQNLRGDAFGGLLDSRGLDVEAALGIEGGIFGTQPVAGRGDEADASPFAVAHFEDLEHAIARGDVALSGHRAHVLILHFGAALLQLADQHEDGFQQVERLEAAHHERDAEIARQLLVFGVAHDRADVSGGDEALYAVLREAQQQADSGWHEHVRYQDGKITQAFARGLPNGHGVGRLRGFGTDGQAHQPALGVLPGDRHRVHRGVGDAHVAAFGFDAE